MGRVKSSAQFRQTGRIAFQYLHAGAVTETPETHRCLNESTTEEKQEVVTNCDHLSKLRFSPTLPYVFTEHGVVMAASMLNSPRAVEVSVFVVRAFVKLRQLVLAHKELAGRLDQLERKVGSHDNAIKQLIAAIRQLTAPPPAAPKIKLAFT